MGDVEIINIVLVLIPVFFSIIAHEFAHGWTACKLGDDTAKIAGRLSFNPIRHVDPLGTIAVPLMLLWSGSAFLFGWAKPVPVNFSALRNPKRDLILVSSAGIVVNLILMLIAVVVLKFSSYMNDYFISLFVNLFIINLILAFFNLLPIPPLDGSKILYGLFPNKWTYKYADSEHYGFMVIITMVIILPYVGNFIGLNLDILGMYLSSVMWFFAPFLE